MNEIKLKPCPFCGWEFSSVEIEDVNEWGMTLFVVECDRCGAKTGTHPSRELAKGWWDRREERKEVVQCKDCKHRPTMPEDGEEVQDLEFPDDVCPLQCGDAWYNQEPADDWYCANGERSEE